MYGLSPLFVMNRQIGRARNPTASAKDDWETCADEEAARDLAPSQLTGEHELEKLSSAAVRLSGLPLRLLVFLHCLLLFF
jgi:hypothetical protein